VNTDFRLLIRQRHSNFGNFCLSLHNIVVTVVAMYGIATSVFLYADSAISLCYNIHNRGYGGAGLAPWWEVPRLLLFGFTYEKHSKARPTPASQVKNWMILFE